MASKVLTLDEAADRLRLHRTTVRGLIDSGRLRAKKVGRTWRLTEAAVEKFLTDEDKRGPDAQAVSA